MSREPHLIYPPEKWWLLKQIKLVKTGDSGNKFSFGIILYKRLFHKNYEMVKVPEDQKDMNYRMNYPMQELFPSDDANKLFFESIKASFPDSIIHNTIVASSMNDEYISYVQQRASEEAHIAISPDFSSVDYSKLGGQSFDGYRRQFRVYSDFTRGSIQNLFFYGYYDLKSPEILDKLDNLVFI